jgi:serralysin
MAIYVFDTPDEGRTTNEAGTDAFTIDSSGNILILGQGVEFVATGRGSAGISTEIDNSLLIYGRVHSEFSSAIVMHGTLTVGSTGTITGGVDGVYLYAANNPGQPHVLNNAGSISGSLYGARLEADENVVINSGRIVGGIGIAASGSERSLVITNTGLIEGTRQEAIQGGKNGSTIKNQGQIKGNVLLGSGDDVYDGRGGTITGFLDLNAGTDVAYGGNGSEAFRTWWGTKFVDGGGGIDTLHYEQAAKVDLRTTGQQKTSLQSWDTIRNIENLSGSEGNDSFIGNAAVNMLLGGAGNDRLDGGLGRDELTGGSGRDVFVFTTNLKGNVDVITDFSSADDTIHLSKAIFSKMAKGVLKQSAFFSGTKAKDANDRIGYDKSTGDLFYDADGTGARYAAVKFAHLDPFTTIKAGDFWIA